ncbi:MAG TPA: ATP-binding protein, partial [Acidobacteriota bacterium]|nr:ATP-binding protein [Acidobacteriota bacterium]
VLLLVSVVSFLFYGTRFRYSMELQEEFIQQNAARQVIGQRANVQEMLRVSTDQLDAALQNITLDPRIQDLPYRLWLRTQFARTGYKSAVELYDEGGAQLNGFSLGLPALHNLNVVRMALGTRWIFQSLEVPFGSIRRRVFMAVRRLDNGGYIAVQAMESMENLPFVPSNSPVQEAFRPEFPAGKSVDSMALCVYDVSWHPVFESNSDLVPSVEQARRTLRDRRDAWMDDSISGQPVRAYFFAYKQGAAALVVPKVSLRSHIVQLIDLFLLNLLWLGAFSLILYLFFRPYLSLHFRTETPIRFSFFQKLLFAFLVFSMVPMLFLSYLIRNYVWEKKTAEVTSRAVYSFSVASRVISDYIISSGPSGRHEVFSDDTLEWIGQVAQQDVSVYFESMLIATSVRDFYGAGLLGERLQGDAYVDLFLKGRKYSFGESQIGSLKYLNVSGRVHRGHYKDEVITIPFLIDRRSVEEEIVGLREYMMLTGAGLILFAVLIGWFLARRFVRPVQVLIDGTGEMSQGNLRYRIPQQYRDEFQQLVGAFNAMANSLDEQQQALERRRQYIENILNHITTAVISIDRTMHVATANPAAAEMLGIDAYGRPLLEEAVSRPGAWPELGTAARQFLASPRELQMREVAEFRTNRELHFRLVYVPLFQEQEWAGAVLLVEDISDIIQSNRLAAFAEMARRVAHEVKNPLTPIQLAVEHLTRVYQDGTKDFESVLKNCSEAVLKQVKTLRRLVSDFSQYGRPSVLNRVETDVRSFLMDVAKSYEIHLPVGIRMETQIDPDLPSVRMDVEKIRGAIMNIIENGLQAMNGSGSITLRASRQDGGIQIAVRDSGAGIPPEIQRRLFEPYFSTKSGGTGLGLAIARKNVEDHGGKIAVESAPGQGTTVVIALPLK